ncbi:MAG: pyrimidine dimer DNA glycosylase/endonuclease V [Candidatus Zapsychrus exili]|nr:pyrimidine dimer DNA glycosylase/endonuclease V [Candidatus Zapsychrus exili]
MRIWDITPQKLCRSHLLGEHRELHAIWSILTNNKKGYSKHPETLRWGGKLNALFLRHEDLVKEIERRGYNYRSPLDKRKASGLSKQDIFVNSVKEQKEILKAKACKCKI